LKRLSCLIARASACSALASLFFLSAPVRAGELRKASDNALSTAPPPQPEHEHEESHERPRGESSGSDGGNAASGLAAILFEVVVLSPFWIPHVALESGPVPSQGWSFASAPYGEGAVGYLRPVGPDEDGTPRGIDPEKRRPLSVQLALDGLSSLDGSFGRVQAGARLLTHFRLELDAAYGLYLERGAAGGASSAWLGHGHISYRFAQREQVQFRAGIGVRHWVDARGWAVGPDAVYAIDIAWGRPITTALEASAGYLGRSAWAGELRGTVGWVVGFGEAFAGYDGVWVGGQGPTAYLGGPVIGFRAYL
jgi:hypothetical protein